MNLNNNNNNKQINMNNKEGMIDMIYNYKEINLEMKLLNKIEIKNLKKEEKLKEILIIIIIYLIIYKINKQIMINIQMIININIQMMINIQMTDKYIYYNCILYNILLIYI